MTLISLKTRFNTVWVSYHVRIKRHANVLVSRLYNIERGTTSEEMVEESNGHYSIIYNLQYSICL